MEPVDEAELTRAIDAFKRRLREGPQALTLVREFITYGSARMLDDAHYTKLREQVGSALGVVPNQDVLVVGSAKLGFSIKPARRWGYFDDDSDVDVAVVSAPLYESLWSEARRFSRGGGGWEGDDRNHFKNDHVAGVIKPYVLPDSDVIPTRRMLFDLESDLQRLGGSPYPVTLAVWHDMPALEEYQLVAVGQCLEETNV